MASRRPEVSPLRFVSTSCDLAIVLPDASTGVHGEPAAQKYLVEYQPKCTMQGLLGTAQHGRSRQHWIHAQTLRDAFYPM